MAMAKHLAEHVGGPACCETTGERLIPVDIALEKGLALAAAPCSGSTGFEAHWRPMTE